LSGSETVLVVEDDPVLRAVAVRLLRDRGYSVLEAPSGRDALSIATSYPGPIDLLLTDVVMPHMSGIELARRLLEVRRKTRVLYTSGYSDEAIVYQGAPEPRGEFLPKPYVAGTLLAKVRAVLDAAG
jgi:CheY-like chemotaxis protein